MVIRERNMKDFEYISTKTWITLPLFDAFYAWILT